jgi:hypothetical protein
LIKTGFHMSGEVQVRYYVLLTAIVSLSLGCGGEKVPDVQPVTGVVTLDDKPIEGANVALVPNGTDKTRSAGGTTDAEGKFSVKTYWNAEHQLEGALPGDYLITVMKMEAPKETEAAKDPKEMMSSPMQMRSPKSLLPKRYNQPTTSGFTVSVTADKPPEPLKLDLKSGGK